LTDPEPSLRELRRALGQKLKDTRTAAGWSQQQLAHKIGYTRSGVSSAACRYHARDATRALATLGISPA
jgi:transcriptional regulator with XRE-family HTH domain